jgi:hypothetical protein
MSDEEPLSENERRARMFDSMAAQLRLNHEAKFGGAFLLIPPDSTEEQCHSFLALNQEQPGIFWATVQTIANIAVDATNQKQRQQGFGR